MQCEKVGPGQGSKEFPQLEIICGKGSPQNNTQPNKRKKKPQKNVESKRQQKRKKRILQREDIKHFSKVAEQLNEMKMEASNIDVMAPETLE